MKKLILTLPLLAFSSCATPDKMPKYQEPKGGMVSSTLIMDNPSFLGSMSLAKNPQSTVFVSEINGQYYSGAPLFRDKEMNLKAGANRLGFLVTAGAGSDANGSISFNAKGDAKYRIYGVCIPKSRGHRVIIENFISKKTISEVFVPYGTYQKRAKLYTPAGVQYY